MTNMARARSYLALTTICGTLAFLLASANAMAVPHLNVESLFGAKADGSKPANFCTVSSGDTCQAGEVSSIVGGFGEGSPQSVAVAPNGNIVIADTLNHRVQELKPNGEFVLMFGKNVNKTTSGNLCTQAEVGAGAQCGAGEAGGEAGEFTPDSVAVDPTSGNVYVTEGGFGNNRVDEFTENGQFVLMIGKGVNEKTGGNLCTQAEVLVGTRCRAGAELFAVAFEPPEHGALVVGAGGNEIAAGGPKDLLYVGNQHRIEEFEANGTWVGEVPLEGISNEFFMIPQYFAVDRTSGDVYLTYSEFGTHASSIYKFAPGASLPEAHFTLKAREVGAGIGVEGIALDSGGHLAVIEEETHTNQNSRWFGSLLDAATGRWLSRFTVLPGVGSHSYVPGLAFGSAGGLYSAASERSEGVGYVPREAAELLTGSSSCQEGGAGGEEDILIGCTLHGEANPSNVSETEVWFRIGKSAILGGPGTIETPKQQVSGNTLKAVTPEAVEGLRPNTTYHYQLSAYDHNVKAPEVLESEALPATTPMVAPRIIGQPSVPFVKSSSAVLSGQINPENAQTEYFFEYQACGTTGCGPAKKTPAQQSAAYSEVGTTVEITELQPHTTYRYQLVANNHNQPEVKSAQGEFTTASGPLLQALTGPHSAVMTTSAVVAGEVNPGGQPAVYTFELGVYNGEQTQYGVVLSGPVGATSQFVHEELLLSGLQPGTVYAYKIKVTSAYGSSTGAPVLFETQGVPTVLMPPPGVSQLLVPKIPFPNYASGKPKQCRHGFKRDKHGHCVRAKSRKKTGGKKRARHARGK